MAKRFWYLGWFGLPLAWATNAYYFWPHLKDDTPTDMGLTADGPADDGSHPDVIRKDPVVRKYAMMSLRGAQAARLRSWRGRRRSSLGGRVYSGRSCGAS